MDRKTDLAVLGVANSADIAATDDSLRVLEHADHVGFVDIGPVGVVAAAEQKTY